MGNVNLQREAYWAYYLQTLCHGGLNEELQFVPGVLYIIN